MLYIALANDIEYCFSIDHPYETITRLQEIIKKSEDNKNQSKWANRALAYMTSIHPLTLHVYLFYY